MHNTRGHYPRWLRTDEVAAALGISEATVRRRAEAGEYDGAVRLSGDRGPWRFPPTSLPTNDSTPSSQGRAGGVSADTGSRVAPDLMSTAPTVGAHLVADAQRVAAELHSVTTRPARAAAAMLAPLVAIASRHFPNRDGWCASCGYQHPCRDYVDAATALQAAGGIVVDGVA